MTVAVAMASTGSNLGLYTNLKALERKPSSRAAPFRCFLGLDSVLKPHIIPKRRYYNLHIHSLLDHLVGVN